MRPGMSKRLPQIPTISTPCFSSPGKERQSRQRSRFSHWQMDQKLTVAVTRSFQCELSFRSVLPVTKSARAGSTASILNVSILLFLIFLGGRFPLRESVTGLVGMSDTGRESSAVTGVWK